MKNTILLFTFLFLIHKTNFAQEVINVEGLGNTCSQARNDAFINAINKAFGSVVYSRTELNNDSLIRDEINILTSGNILNYDEIKPCSEINGKWSISLRVTVSKTELKKFIEGKGKSVAISGELLKQKLDQEVISTESELSIINNLLYQLELLASEPFDYEISPGKVRIKDGKYFDLPAEISIKTNVNFYNIYLKLIKEIEKISVNKTDQTFRLETLQKSNYRIELNSKVYFLRNEKSIQQINKFYAKLISKFDDFIVVDGCLNELFLKEINKIINLKQGLFFPEPGFLAKTISGSFTKTIEEIASLDRISIFSSSKLIEYKKGKSLNHELNLMKYSETNPLEFIALKNNLLKSFEDLTKEKEDGAIKLLYNISYSKDGFNNSSIQDIKVSQKKYQQTIESSINQIKLNPTKLCGSFIKTIDSINLDYKWETYSSRFIYKKGSSSDYVRYLNSQNLPHGTYILTVKDKVLNDDKFKDIFISNYTTRGPFSAVYSAIIPGWGTRRITYNEKKGWNRFALVVAPLALSIISKSISNSNYNEYMKATEQSEIDKYFTNANTMNKCSKIFSALAATFYVYDIISVFGKGLNNISKKNKIKEEIKNSKLQIQNQQLQLK